MIHPKTFADRYVAAWNNRNSEEVLRCFDTNAELRSPFAKLFAKTAILKGHADIKTFYNESIRRRPNLRIEMLDAFGGHESVAILWRDEVGRSTIFTAVVTPSGKISQAIVCYNKADGAQL